MMFILLLFSDCKYMKSYINVSYIIVTFLGEYFFAI